MSQVAIIGNASGTGVFTVASPNSNVDRVLTLPDETGTVDTLQRSGNVIQVVNFQTGALATGTTIIPLDDTIPQITEGNEYMTLAITPTNASNILIIDVVFIGAVSSLDAIIAAVFQDSVANALASLAFIVPATNYYHAASFKHKMVAGTTSPTTMRVRIGPATGGSTFTFNGIVGTRRFGGSYASSITITEYTP